MRDPRNPHDVVRPGRVVPLLGERRHRGGKRAGARGLALTAKRAICSDCLRPLGAQCSIGVRAQWTPRSDGCLTRWYARPPKGRPMLSALVAPDGWNLTVPATRWRSPGKELRGEGDGCSPNTGATAVAPGTSGRRCTAPVRPGRSAARQPVEHRVQGHAGLHAGEVHAEAHVRTRGEADVGQLAAGRCRTPRPAPTGCRRGSPSRGCRSPPRRPGWAHRTPRCPRSRCA